MKNLLSKEFGLQIHPKLSITIYDFMLSDILASVYFYQSQNKELSIVDCDENPDVFNVMMNQTDGYLDSKHLFNFSRNLKRNFSYVDVNGKSHKKIQQQYVGEIVFNELIRSNIVGLHKSGKNNLNDEMSIYYIKKTTVELLLSKYKKELLGHTDKEYRKQLIIALSLSQREMMNDDERLIADSIKNITLPRVDIDKNIFKYFAFDEISNQLNVVKTCKYTNRCYTALTQMQKDDRSELSFKSNKKVMKFVEIDIHACMWVFVANMVYDESFIQMFVDGDFYENFIELMKSTTYDVAKYKYTYVTDDNGFQKRKQSKIGIETIDIHKYIKRLESVHYNNPSSNGEFQSPLTRTGCKTLLLSYLNKNCANTLVDTVLSKHFPTFFAKLKIAKESLKKCQYYKFDNGFEYNPLTDMYSIDKGTCFFSICCMQIESKVFDFVEYDEFVNAGVIDRKSVV